MMQLGCCYYPEHWPEALWADDARRMADLGLSRVRIGEFAWSRIEPEPGRFDWGWLDRAMDILGAAGLGVILGTPTATPPKWLVDQMPDMLAVDRHGRPRGFGSRRHYCFSHAGYRGESARITAALAERYAAHPALAMWQTDNEFGCHDTTRSYSTAALAAFRAWLAQRYGSVEALNAGWGNVFWSMDYRSFDAIELPNGTVTEANPSHWLAFYRFSSDQVVAFNRVQVDILRSATPDVPITHNVMGFVTDFDHVHLGRDLDVVTWDSYPLGFLEEGRFSTADKRAYQRQGHPDTAAFHHDLYRGCGQGRWGVMEQQPGPVNWAGHNPAPLAGMVRLWTLEAAAHGAELVSYFRWRQAPFAQEQMHAGLLRPDSIEAPAAPEVRAAAADLRALGDLGAVPRSVALIVDYPGEWVTRIQPQGASAGSAFEIAYDWYSAARQWGLDVDIVGPDADLSGYRLILLPCLPIIPPALAARLAASDAAIIIGARTASKTDELTIPPQLALSPLDAIFPGKVTRVESLRGDCPEQGDGWQVQGWIDEVETGAAIEWATTKGRAAVYRHGQVRYIAGGADQHLALAVIGRAADDAGLSTVLLPEGLRTRRIGDLLFLFNYAAVAQPVPLAWADHPVILGAAIIAAAGVTVLRFTSKAA